MFGAIVSEDEVAGIRPAYQRESRLKLVTARRNAQHHRAARTSGRA